MQLVTDYAVPTVLSGYARAALADFEENAFTLSAWLPSDTVDDLTYSFQKGGAGLTEAAVFRAYDASSDNGTRVGATRVSGSLPPISRKIPVGEYEKLQQRAQADRTSDDDVDGVLDDGARLTREIAARVELARGDALFNASVTIAENNVTASVDFGRTVGHSVVLDGVTDALWDDTEDSTPFDNLEEWTEIYRETTGELPAFVMMPERIRRLLQSNAQLCRMSTTDPVPPVMLSEEKLNTLLQEHDLPQIVTYDARVSFKGVTTRVTPADKVCFLPAKGDALGQTLWGTTTEAQDPEYGMRGSGDEAGVLVANFRTEDPQTIWTRATAIVLPVVAAPDRTFVAKVI
ncbi:major capsid protein [Streptomyces sp. NPDC006285]|uniref:major capsid protein n=1 Tax=Streptomyces sp. NPDC006285 TaxID=3364742 RepID=UPI0036A96A79